MNVADGQTQPDLLGLQPRCLFVGLKSLLLPHEPGCNRGDRDPALRIFGFDLDQTTGGSPRLVHGVGDLPGGDGQPLGDEQRLRVGFLDLHAGNSR